LQEFFYTREDGEMDYLIQILIKCDPKLRI